MRGGITERRKSIHHLTNETLSKDLRNGIFSTKEDKSKPLTKTSSGLRKVLGAFATIPPNDLWLRSGIVERQTVSTDMHWLPRLMILTSDAIIFAKEGSDVILDKLPLKNVSFVGKVSEHIEISSAIQSLSTTTNARNALLPGRSSAGRPCDFRISIGFCDAAWKE